MEFKETLLARRSVRQFTDEPVSDEDIEKILEAHGSDNRGDRE